MQPIPYLGVSGCLWVFGYRGELNMDNQWFMVLPLKFMSTFWRVLKRTAHCTARVKGHNTLVECTPFRKVGRGVVA